MTSRSEATERFALSDANRAPRYMQMLAVVRDWIAQGRYAPGAQLEPEKKLGELFGVSRITVRKVLDILAREGWVESQQGRGTFVRQRQPQAVLHASMEQRVASARELARASRVRDLRIETIPADSVVAEDLRMAARGPVLHISYVRIRRGKPIGFVQSFCPGDLGLRVTPEDFAENTLLTLMESKGVELSGIDHLLGATLADATLAEQLSVTLGAPLVRVRMLMLDKAHRPVQKVLGYFRADQYEHHVFLARQGGESIDGNNG